MGGFLTFGTRFEPRFAAGQTQGEYASYDEETWDLSYGESERMVVAAEELGVSRDAWPNFVDEDGRADLVTPQEIEHRNSALASAMHRLNEEQVSSNEHLLLVWRKIGEGKALFIDH